MQKQPHPAVAVIERVERLWTGDADLARMRAEQIVKELIIFDVVLGCIDGDGRPVIMVEKPAVKSESDDKFRQRIQAAAGYHTVNQGKIEKDTGAALDEVGSFYGAVRGVTGE